MKSNCLPSVYILALAFLIPLLGKTWLPPLWNNCKWLSRYKLGINYIQESCVHKNIGEINRTSEVKLPEPRALSARWSSISTPFSFQKIKSLALAQLQWLDNAIYQGHSTANAKHKVNRGNTRARVFSAHLTPCANSKMHHRPSCESSMVCSNVIFLQWGFDSHKVYRLTKWILGKHNQTAS